MILPTKKVNLSYLLLRNYFIFLLDPSYRNEIKTYISQKANYINEEEEGDSGVEDLCRLAKYKEDLFLKTIQENHEVCAKILRDKEIYKMNLFMKIVHPKK